MTKYLSGEPFSVALGSKAYSDGWDAIQWEKIEDTPVALTVARPARRRGGSWNDVCGACKGYPDQSPDRACPECSLPGYIDLQVKLATESNYETVAVYLTIDEARALAQAYREMAERKCTYTI